MLVDFGRALRSKGLAIGSGDILTYCKAMAPLDPTDLVDLYWAGRTTLIMRREDIVVYDEVFRAFFLASDSPVQQMLKVKAQSDPEAET
ncbi:MAG: vWA domain-containing protein, partial [Pseudonocardiaceae bacterium]